MNESQRKLMTIQVQKLSLNCWVSMRMLRLHAELSNYWGLLSEGLMSEWKYLRKGSKVSRIKWLCYRNLFYKTLFLSSLASDCSFLLQSVFVCPPQFQLLSSLIIRQVDKYIMINILQLICQLLLVTLTL